MISVETLPSFHQKSLEAWSVNLPTRQSIDESWDCISANHAYNFLLWRTEDNARRDDLGEGFVYRAKREIDKLNQLRNNQMEAIDTYFSNKLLPPELDSGCPVHSETPGMMIDRLSILSLKYFHMRIQAEREDVDAAHREACAQKSTIIARQRDILFRCLCELIEGVQEKKRTFIVYRQLKMYNDPALNPALYQKEGTTLGKEQGADAR